jgi:hypothetical protein
MNAYELADHLEKANYVGAFKAANMLRQQADKLHKYELRNLAQCDRIAILEAQNKQQADRIAELEKQTKPLSDEEILKVWNSFERDDSNLPFVNFARAIEERHGIK